MADIDFFGYTRHNAGKYLPTSDYSALYFANTAGGTGTPSKRAGLVQSTAVSYQHRVEPRFEIGSSDIYWVTGQAMGAVTMNRVVGERGFFDGVQVGGAGASLEKGVIGTVEFKAGGQVGLKQDVITMTGCVLQGFGINSSVGGLEVSEGITVNVGMMQKKALGNGGLVGVVTNVVQGLFNQL